MIAHDHLAWSAATILVGAGLGWILGRASFILPRTRAFARTGRTGGGCFRILGLTAGGAAIGLWSQLVFAGPLAVLTTILGCWLLLLAVLDGAHFWLPDTLTIPLLVFGLLVAAVEAPQNLPHRAAGVASGFLILAAIAFAYARLRGRPGLGGGDARLLAAAGAWVGWAGIPSVLLWASLSALVVVAAKAAVERRLDPAGRIPFGIYLSWGTWLTWLHGPIGLGPLLHA